MRTIKTALVIVLVSLGFLGGYFAGWILHGENVVRLSQGERDAAKRSAQLQQRIIEELQGRYYRQVDVDELSAAGVKGLLKSLDDPYTVYMSSKETKELRERTGGEYSGIGAALQKKNGSLLITAVFDGSPAADAGLEPGDHILSVDGKSTADVTVETSVARIKGEAGTQVTLRVRRKGQQKVEQLTLTRRTIVVPQTRSSMRRAADGSKVGYVALYEFNNGAGNQVRRDVLKLQQRGARSIVLDLRYNGGGLLSEAVDVTNVFMKGVVVSTRGLHSPLEVFEAREETATGLPMVVLVNGYTASAAEIVTGALGDRGRATVIGTRTFGKGLVQSIVPLGDGSSLKLTTAVYYTPNGRDINTRGIKPRIVSNDDPDTKKDETLQRALKYVGRD